MSKTITAFLCHSSEDKPAVRELYSRLKANGVSPWLDEEDLLPGEDWKLTINNAVRSADIVLVCLSKSSILKTGFVQKEISYALDRADEHPEGEIYIVPLCLEPCGVPDRLRKWNRVDLFAENGFKKLIDFIKSLKNRVRSETFQLENKHAAITTIDQRLESILYLTKRIQSFHLSLSRILEGDSLREERLLNQLVKSKVLVEVGDWKCLEPIIKQIESAKNYDDADPRMLEKLMSHSARLDDSRSSLILAFHASIQASRYGSRHYSFGAMLECGLTAVFDTYSARNTTPETIKEVLFTLSQQFEDPVDFSKLKTPQVDENWFTWFEIIKEILSRLDQEKLTLEQDRQLEELWRRRLSKWLEYRSPIDILTDFRPLDLYCRAAKKYPFCLLDFDFTFNAVRVWSDILRLGLFQYNGVPFWMVIPALVELGFPLPKNVGDLLDTIASLSWGHSYLHNEDKDKINEVFQSCRDHEEIRNLLYILVEGDNHLDWWRTRPYGVSAVLLPWDDVYENENSAFLVLVEHIYRCGNGIPVRVLIDEAKYGSWESCPNNSDLHHWLNQIHVVPESVDLSSIKGLDELSRL